MIYFCQFSVGPEDQVCYSVYILTRKEKRALFLSYIGNIFLLQSLVLNAYHHE